MHNKDNIAKTGFLLITLFLLVTASITNASTTATTMTTPRAIDTSNEYQSGVLEEDPLWYTWINTSGVQLIYITAIFPDYGFYFPSFHLLGQHYYT